MTTTTTTFSPRKSALISRYMPYRRSSRENAIIFPLLPAVSLSLTYTHSFILTLVDVAIIPRTLRIVLDIYIGYRYTYYISFANNIERASAARDWCAD